MNTLAGKIFFQVSYTTETVLCIFGILLLVGLVSPLHLFLLYMTLFKNSFYPCVFTLFNPSFYCRIKLSLLPF